MKLYWALFKCSLDGALRGRRLAPLQGSGQLRGQTQARALKVRALALSRALRLTPAPVME